MFYTVLAISGVAGATAVATKGDPLATMGSALLSGAVVHTVRHPVATSRMVAPIARPVGAFAFRSVMALAGDIGIMARAAASTTTASIGAAAVAGYVLGSTSAIMGSAVLEEAGVVKKGTTSQLTEFYTFGMAEGDTTSRRRDKWYESDIPILNIPGDVWYIAHYYI